MLKALNEKYYDLFGDLYTNRALLPDHQYKVMALSLMQEYKKELEELVGNHTLKVARSVYELRFRLKNEVPRGFWFFQNPVARAYKKACKAALADFLAALEEMHQEETVAEETVATLPPPAPTEEDTAAQETTALQ